MQPRDWILLVIARADGDLQPVQLQKSLFLIGENLRGKDLSASPFYRFRAYDYGPFSPEVYQDAEALESDGFVSIRRPPISRFKLYSATPAGRKRAVELRRALTPKAAAYLTNVVAFVKSLSFEELVSAVYAAFPAMRVNSVFRDPT